MAKSGGAGVGGFGATMQGAGIGGEIAQQLGTGVAGWWKSRGTPSVGGSGETWSSSGAPLGAELG
jgi:hypothetical protein